MNLDSGVKRITIGTPPKRELTDIIAPGTSGGSTRSSGKSSGSGGGGGSTYIPVVDVLTKVPGAEAYKSVVTKKKAKIDLSELGGGDVSDVTVNGTSVVDPETKVAEVVIPPPPAVPVQDVQLDNHSVVDQYGIANFDSDDFGTKVQANPQGTPQAHLSTIGIDGNVYDIPGSGGGTVSDVQVATYHEGGYQSVLDENGVAKLGSLAKFIAPRYGSNYSADSPFLAISAYTNMAYDSSTNPEADLNVIKDVRYCKLNDNDAWFDMVNYFQRAAILDDGLKMYPKRQQGGGYKMHMSFKDGTYPMFGLQINDMLLQKESSNQSAVQQLDIEGHNGIDVTTYNKKINIYYTAPQRPDQQLVYMDSNFPDDIETEETTVTEYSVEETGSYLIMMIGRTKSTGSISINVDGPNMVSFFNQGDTYTYIYTNSNRTETQYWATRFIVAKLTAGTTLTFTWIHDPISEWRHPTVITSNYDAMCCKAVYKLNNFDLTNASLLYHNSDELYSGEEGPNNIDYSYNRSALSVELSVPAYSKYADWGGIGNGWVRMYNTYVPSGQSSRVTIDPFFSNREAIYAHADEKIGDEAIAYISYENSPDITQSKRFKWWNSAGSNDLSHQSLMVVLTFPLYNETTGYVTDSQLNNAVNTLESNFQDGVDDIYQACISKGSTPASYSLADVIDGVLNIPQNSDATPPMYTLRMILDDGVGKATTDVDGRYGMYVPLRSDGTYNLPFGTDPDSFKIRIKFKFDNVDAGSRTEIGLCGSYNGDWFGLPVMYVYKVGSQYVIWGGVGASSSAWDASVEVNYAISSRTWYIYDLIWNRGSLMAKLYDEAGNLLGDDVTSASNSFYINQSAYFQFGGILNNNTVFASDKGLSIDTLQTYVDIDGARVFGADIIGNARGVYIETESYYYPTPVGTADSSINATATITTTAMEGS
ncbi:MAG: hypothetical protein J6U54_11130 [Clostridiales bacterium]|nr:hypothetical protein [Clostridiales bacterium]